MTEADRPDVTLEREYSPSSRAGGTAEPHLARYRHQSAAIAAGWGPRLEHLAGGTLLVAGSPTLVFVHGGYWQALSAAASLVPGPAAVDDGWGYAAVEYTLAPAAGITTMVAECTEALRLVAERSGGPLVVAGHSAGAHLVAMATLVAEPPVEVSRVVLVSGVYDLRPIVHTTVNEPLGLAVDEAIALSPVLRGVRRGAAAPEVVIAWGQLDTAAFAAQSMRYSEVLASAGVSVETIECVGLHHFDIIDGLADQRTPLGRLTTARVRTSAPHPQGRAAQ